MELRHHLSSGTVTSRSKRKAINLYCQCCATEIQIGLDLHSFVEHWNAFNDLHSLAFDCRGFDLQTTGIRIDPVRPPTRSNLGRICQAGPSNPNDPSSREEWADAKAGTYQLSFTVTAAFIASTLSGPGLGRGVVGAPLQLAPEIQICFVTLPWIRNLQGTGAAKIKTPSAE
jgi:hypothetical protein